MDSRPHPTSCNTLTRKGRGRGMPTYNTYKHNTTYNTTQHTTTHVHWTVTPPTQGSGRAGIQRHTKEHGARRQGGRGERCSSHATVHGSPCRLHVHACRTGLVGQQASTACTPQPTHSTHSLTYLEHSQGVGQTHVVHGHEVVLGSQTGLVTRGGVHRLEGHLTSGRQSVKHSVRHLVHEVIHEPGTTSHHITSHHGGKQEGNKGRGGADGEEGQMERGTCTDSSPQQTTVGYR